MPGFAGTEDPIIANDVTEFSARPSDRMVQEQRDRPVKPTFTALERGKAAARERQKNQIIPQMMFQMKRKEATAVGFTAAFQAWITKTPAGSAFSDLRYSDVVAARDRLSRLNRDVVDTVRLKSNVTDQMIEDEEKLLPRPLDWFNSPDTYIANLAELTRRIKADAKIAGKVWDSIGDPKNSNAIEANRAMLKAIKMINEIGPVIYNERQYNNLDTSEHGVWYYFPPTEELLYKRGPGEVRPGREKK